MEFSPQRPDQDTLCTVQYTATEDQGNSYNDLGILAFSSKGTVSPGFGFTWKIFH
jgi:hypothetical protein